MSAGHRESLGEETGMPNIWMQNVVWSVLVFAANAALVLGLYVLYKLLFTPWKNPFAHPRQRVKSDAHQHAAEGRQRLRVIRPTAAPLDEPSGP